MQKNQSFTEGKIMAPLIAFSLPVLLALVLQAMYGAVDLMVVGQFAEASAVSAVSTGSQVMHTVTSVIVGLSMGITVLAGQKIGEKQPDEAGRAIGSGIFLFAALGIVLTAVLFLAASLAVSWMHAPKEAFAGTVAYVRICSLGLLFIVAYNVLGSIFRGIGDSRMPLLAVAIACVLNIVGDLLFVCGFHMGAEGAALATMLSQAVSVLLSLLIIRRRKLPFAFSRSYICFDRKQIGRILTLGLPIALQDLLVSISFLAILAIVNSIGLIASAGLGVAEKLCMFVMLVPAAFMQSMSAFVAQNIGAGEAGRARKALLYGIVSSLAVGVFMFYFSFFHGEALSSIFARDKEIIAASALYLKAYGIDCLLTSFLFCFLGYFNGCGNTAFVMIQGVTGAFAVRMPVSYLVSQKPWATLFHIGLATPASTLVQIALSVGFFAWREKKRKRLPGD